MLDNRDPKGYYKILGLASGASVSDVKKKYILLVKKYHPDSKSKEADASKFAKVQEAYEVLSDDRKKHDYDSGKMENSFQNGEWSAGSDFGGFRGGFDAFSDLFGDRFFTDVFNQGFSQHQSYPKDLAVKLEGITLEEAYTGLIKEISLLRKGMCELCRGGGFVGSTCRACNGSGVHRVQKGPYRMEVPCQKCMQSGRELCASCSGSGVKNNERRSVRVNIPQGVVNGQKIVCRGEGNFSRGSFGNLIVIVSVKLHEIFDYTERGDIKTKICLPFAYAIKGGVVDIPCVDGQTRQLNVPAGTQYGAELRVPGGGMKIGAFMFVKVEFEFPKNPNPNLMESLNSLDTTNGYPGYLQSKKKLDRYAAKGRN